MFKKFIEEARKSETGKNLKIDENLEILLDFTDGELVIFGERMKAYKLPKKVTSEWIENKIEKYQINDYTPISKIVKEEMKKLKINDYIIYPTSYGLGISTLYLDRKRFEDLVKKAKDILEKNKFEVYKEEFSDANWVYRLKISKKFK